MNQYRLTLTDEEINKEIRELRNAKIEKPKVNETKQSEVKVDAKNIVSQYENSMQKEYYVIIGIVVLVLSYFLINAYFTN